MAALIYLDTHVVFWLYAEGAEADLSEPAREMLRTAEDLRISPIVRLELQYLYEIERIGTEPALILDELGITLGLSLCDAPFASVVREAERYGWTRDPFDRLIVAQSALHDAPLITKGAAIHAHYGAAVW